MTTESEPQAGPYPIVFKGYESPPGRLTPDAYDERVLFVGALRARKYKITVTDTVQGRQRITEATADQATARKASGLHVLFSGTNLSAMLRMIAQADRAAFAYRIARAHVVSPSPLLAQYEAEIRRLKIEDAERAFVTAFGRSSLLVSDEDWEPASATIDQSQLDLYVDIHRMLKERNKKVHPFQPMELQDKSLRVINGILKEYPQFAPEEPTTFSPQK